MRHRRVSSLRKVGLVRSKPTSCMPTTAPVPSNACGRFLPSCTGGTLMISPSESSATVLPRCASMRSTQLRRDSAATLLSGMAAIVMSPSDASTLHPSAFSVVVSAADEVRTKAHTVGFSPASVSPRLFAAFCRSASFMSMRSCDDSLPKAGRCADASLGMYVRAMATYKNM